MKKFEILMPIKKDEPLLEKEYGGSSGLESAFANTAINFEEITSFIESLGSYELDNIELNLEAAVETNGITKLFVGASGSAGVKVTIKKKS
ncbi:hypothetical protein RKK46_000876 [Listeria innocua]|uniref:hypothetical protein n=1 Tax=Listeria innocua TaxID=1642 RepID=UPI0005EF051C|nr:hypothetical protein [Listeria innocua]EAE6207314.1 hypothetical protein [Listeria innocua]EEP3926102.1 hypothetical protein [Listeria innocua]EIX7076874.1 hypothetical protein [Listeria innocua]EIX7080781.1 hypothetical protein [Listeria innocua]EIX7084168.1 hypothetical protein [Listeria innocua]